MEASTKDLCGFTNTHRLEDFGRALLEKWNYEKQMFER